LKLCTVGSFFFFSGPCRRLRLFLVVWGGRAFRRVIASYSGHFLVVWDKRALRVVLASSPGLFLVFWDKRALRGGSGSIGLLLVSPVGRDGKQTESSRLLICLFVPWEKRRRRSKDLIFFKAQPKSIKVGVSANLNLPYMVKSFIKAYQFLPNTVRTVEGTT
jgi:hypothetical protein